MSLEAIPPKDIAIAALGASVGLASVLVVFMGFLLSHAWTLPNTTPTKVLRRYKLAARWGLAPTGLATLEALACYGWLLFGYSCLYHVWVPGFFVASLAFLAYAVIAIALI